MAAVVFVRRFVCLFLSILTVHCSVLLFVGFLTLGIGHYYCLYVELSARMVEWKRVHAGVVLLLWGLEGLFSTTLVMLLTCVFVVGYGEDGGRDCIIIVFSTLYLY